MFAAEIENRAIVRYAIPVMLVVEVAAVWKVALEAEMSTSFVVIPGTLRFEFPTHLTKQILKL